MGLSRESVVPLAHRRLLMLLALLVAAALTVVVRRASRHDPARPEASPLPQLNATDWATSDASQAAPDTFSMPQVDVELWRLPSHLPGLAAEPAPALVQPAPEPAIAAVVRRGQVSQTDAMHAARAVWPALAGCGVARDRPIVVTFALSGGLTVGSSAIYEPTFQGVLSDPERECVTQGLRSVAAPVATDCQGQVDVHFGGAQGQGAASPSEQN